MPFFTKKSPTPSFDNNNHKSSTTTNNANILSTASQLPMAQHIIEKKVPPPQIDANILKPQLVFHCQLAHGSPTGLISGFGSVKELYQKIAECYDFPVDEVRNCFSIFNLFLILNSVSGVKFRSALEALSTTYICSTLFNAKVV